MKCDLGARWQKKRGLALDIRACRRSRSTSADENGIRRYTRTVREQHIRRSAVGLSPLPRSCWNFFVSLLSSTARSRRRVGRRFSSTASAQVGKRSGRSPLHRTAAFHFIHFIEAAVSNREPNLLEGISNHYRIVMFGNPNFCWQLTGALCVCGAYPRKGMSSLTDSNVILKLWTIL